MLRVHYEHVAANALCFQRLVQSAIPNRFLECRVDGVFGNRLELEFFHEKFQRRKAAATVPVRALP